MKGLVSDEGVGMDLSYVLEANTAKSLGLVGMRERAELSGGKLCMESTLNEGTAIKAIWPKVHPD
jgi:signal transduction histidine kinase